MFSDTLTLDDSTGTEQTFVRRRFTSDGSEYLDTATTANNARKLLFSHTTSGKGSDVVNRHLFAGKVSGADAGGVIRTGGINLTMNQPIDGVTDAMMIDLLCNMIDHITGGGLTSSGIAASTIVTAFLQGQS